MLGGPTSVVKADTDTASVKTSVVSTTKASSTTTSSTTKSLTTTPKESTSSTTSPVVSSNSSDATTTKNSTPVTTEKIATDTSSTNKNQETSTVKDSTATTANTQTDTSKSENTNAVKSDPTDNIKTPVTEKPAIDTVDTQSDTKKVENTDTVKDESTDDTKAPVTDTTTNTDKNATNVVEPVTTTTADLKVSNLMANLALSKAQLADLGVQATALAITPENATLEDGNIAEGMQGTTPWSIDQSGILHLGDKNKTTTLADNKTTTTDKVSTGSSNTDVSTVTSSPTSPWAGHADSIKTITFDGNVNTASDMNHMFSDLSNLTTITNADKLITPQGSDDDEDKTIKNATGLFANDPKLTSISTISGTTGAQSNTVDLSGWKLGSVTSTEDMFLNDSSIEHIIFPSAQEDTLTKNLNSRYMFKNDTSLKDISFPNWQFRSGDFDMSGMFQNDTSLTTLDLSSWNMNSNTETGDSSKGEGMFDGTDSLTSLHLSVNNKFKNYTGLSSAQGSKWIGGGKTLLADPTGSDGSTTYNLNNLTTNLGTYVKGGTEFKPDGSTATPLNFTLIVPSNMGDIPIPVTGTIYSSVTGDVPQKDGYTANYTQVQGNILADKAVTSYYITYTANPYTTKVSTSKGSQDVDIPAGVVGTTSDPISLPSVNGYIAPQIKVQYTKDGNIITDLKGNVISDDNKLTYTGEPLDNNAAVAVTDPTTGKSVSIDVPDGKVGDSVTLNIPSRDSDGYIAPVLTATYDPNGVVVKDANGNTITADNPASYTGKTISNNTSVAVTDPTTGKSISIDVPDGKVGDSVTLNIPNYDNDGYTAPVLTATYGPDGAVVKDANGNTVTANNPASYTGKSVSNNKAIAVINPTTGKSISIDVPDGKVGDSVTLNIPNYDNDGYTAPVLTATYGPDGAVVKDANGNTVTADNPASYTAKTISNNKAVAVTDPTTGKSISIDVPDGKVGDSVTLKIPNYDNDGYIAPVLTATYDPNGVVVKDANGNTITADNPASYTGKTISNNKPVAVTDPTNGKPVSIVVPDGKVGSSVTLNIPNHDSDGYIAPILTATYGPSGVVVKDANGNTITADDPATYTAKTISNNEAVAVTDPTTGKSVSIDVPDGKVGSSVTLNIPDHNGYITPVLTATYSPNGAIVKDANNNIITVDNPATYTGNANPATNVNVKNPDGTNGEPINIPAGKYGDPDKTISLPEVSGYETPKITVTYGANGKPLIKDQDGNTISEDNSYTYTGVENKKTTINVKTPDGKTVALDIPAGRYGDNPVKISAQNISGYTAPTVIVTYGKDGKPSISNVKTPDKNLSDTDVLTYTKNPSHSSNGNHTNNESNTPSETTSPEQNVQNIATYSEKGQINVYALGSDNKMSAIGNRGLAYQSTWYSDQKVTVDGIQYYRVATNEWVKASQVYPYEDVNFDVRTYDKTAKVLYKSEDEIINNRMLAPNTSWFSDRVTYVINGEKYYRVATNEFVSAKDAYVYEPTNMVVTTNVNIPATALYSAKGELVTNRSLAADTSWLVDSITYINGVKYYRVATNEFVKVSDVDNNH